MAEITPYLKLYKPGGGSSGLIVPDERVDVDRFNNNSDLIDAEAVSVNLRLGVLEGRSQHYWGPASDRALLPSVNPGDTYRETDGSKITWIQTEDHLWRVHYTNGPIPLTLEAGWTAPSGAATFEVRSSMLILNGRLSGTSAAGTNAATLPPDYRPGAERVGMIVDGGTWRDFIVGVSGSLMFFGKGSLAIADGRLATIPPFPLK